MDNLCFPFTALLKVSIPCIMHAVVCHREGLRPSFTALLGALVADDSELTPQGLDWPGEGTRA